MPEQSHLLSPPIVVSRWRELVVYYTLEKMLQSILQLVTQSNNFRLILADVTCTYCFVVLKYSSEIRHSYRILQFFQ